MIPNMPPAAGRHGCNRRVFWLPSLSLGIMRYFTAIMSSLVVLAPGCCSHAKRMASDVKPPTVVSGRTLVAYETTLPQLTSKTRTIAGEVAKPVATVREGLPHVQRVSQRPILAIGEQGHWFFYGTSTATDQTTHQPVRFIAGYAIEKGGREIIEWSVW
jgi:hypothetical protein